jgi:hypothetical protein
MMDFFRFPSTPHLTWLGTGQPRGDKVLSSTEAQELLSHEILVEEKVDGANIGFSVDDHGTLRVQNRGTFLSRQSAHPQFKPLFRWQQSYEHALVDALFPDLMLFGEWCYAVHSVRYTRLPDWFLAFDVYDRAQGEFWSTKRRDAFVSQLGLELVPRLGAGRFDLVGLNALLGPSRLADGPAEGLYVRIDQSERLVARAKIVRPEFMQAIDEHWSRKELQTNTLVAHPGSKHH